MVKGFVVIGLAFLVLTAEASGDATLSYEEQKNLFNSGSPLDLSKIPDIGVAHLTLTQPNNQSGADPYFFVRNTKGEIVVSPTGNKEPSEELNALHLSACPANIYPPLNESKTTPKTVSSWSSFSDQRMVKFDPDGSPRPVPLFVYTWKTAIKDGKDLLIARVDVSDPGFHLQGYGNVAAQKVQGRFYVMGEGVRSLDLSALPAGAKGYCREFIEEYWPYKVTKLQAAAPKPRGRWVLMDMSGIPANEKPIYDMLNNPPRKKWVWVEGK